MFPSTYLSNDLREKGEKRKEEKNRKSKIWNFKKAANWDNEVPKENKEIEITKTTQLKDQKTDKVCCEVDKRIYIADKTFFKKKRAKRRIEKTVTDN